MKLVKLTAIGGALAFVAAWGVAQSTPLWLAPKQERVVDVSDPDLIKQGEYLARAGDCVACHTAPGGAPFAGGLGLQTPLGTIYATNITPDPETGIGTYDYGDFERAVRQGMRPDGKHLYPAMPFVSYRVVSDDDIAALYAYFMSGVTPVSKPNQTTTIPWPASMRWPLAYWSFLFGERRDFMPPEGADEVVSRGAYLVEGLAHCGACHTPRGIGYQEKAVAEDGAYFLSGSVLEGWYAKNLRDEGRGLSTWNEAELVAFLKTGRNEKTAAFGSMADVVEHSLQHLTDEDLTAIARYLKTLPARKGAEKDWLPHEDLTTEALKSGDFTGKGAMSYVAHCSACHRLDGFGAPAIYPALKGNSMIFAEDPSSLIQITLAGGRMAETRHEAMTFTMPAFDHLKNDELAEIMTFIRNSWGNHASEVKPEDIARMRHEISRKPVHFAPEAEQ